MSIQSPSVGVLDIKNATLRVGKLEVASVQGIDASLNTFKANSILLFDDQRTGTTNPFTLSGSAQRNSTTLESTSNIILSSGSVYAGLGLPNAWSLEFDLYAPASGSTGNVDVQFYSTSSTGGGGYKVLFDMDSDPNEITLSYDGTSLKNVTPTVEVNGTWQKVVILYERGVISMSLNDTLVLYHKDIERSGPYTIGTGGFVVFTCNGAADRRIRNVKISNDGPWSFANQSNIAYLNGSVGIGTNAPSEKLEVIGTTKATLFSGSGASLTNIPQSGVVNLTDNVQRISTLETDLGGNSTRISTIESGVTTLSGNKTFQDDVVISGNLTVSGTTTVVDTENISIKDPIIEIGKDNAGSPLADLGVIMTRPSGNSNVAIIFDEDVDTLQVGYTLNRANATTITMDSSSLFHMNVWGNVSASNLSIGQFGVVASYGLDHVTNENNSTGDTIISTNGTTGLQTTANVSVGRDALVSGNVVVSQDLTVDTSTFHVDSSTNRVGILTTSPGYDLDVHGSANVGTLTVGNVSSNLEVGTANLFVDTVSGNVGIGITDPGHNLDIVSEMNLRAVSNTASIKYNSNVVTQYVRSKKLIKYPRVAMTAATTGGYTASATNVLTNDYTNYAPWKAFDTTIDGNVGWATDYLYDTSTGEATTSATSFNNRYGEYIDLQLPDAIKVSHFIIKTRETGTYIPEDSPGDGYLYGSNDGSNWTQLKFFSGLTYGGMATNGNTYEEVQVNATGFYNYLRLQVTKRAGQNANDGFIAIGELEYYGIPEYDPEAHGTDVIARSVPNVPNTDWLEVYYDGQDYTSMPTGSDSIVDKAGGDNDGTPSSDITFDTTWKAFTFYGNDNQTSNIATTITTTGGAWSHSASCWFKLNEAPSDLTDIYSINPVSGSTFSSNAAVAVLHSNSLYLVGGSNDVKISFVPKTNTWYHICHTYPGGGTNTIKWYLNGIEQSLVDTGSSTALDFETTNNVLLGSQMSSHTGMNGSIANFRLFNRALTTDEIWQLYAYQKEYFQVSPDVVTFKGGRLGIGTSEPRAVLDVNGSLKINGSFQQISSSAGKVSIMGQLSNTYVSTSSSSPDTIISGLPEDVTFDRLYTAALGARVFMSGTNISAAGLLCEAKYINFGQVSASTSSKTVELAYVFYDGTYTKLGALKFGVGGDNRSITVYQSKAQYYTGAVNNYTAVTWTNQGSGPGASTYGVKDLIIFY